MKTLAIDIETYSATSLKTAGVHKYIADPNFEILLIAYQIDQEEVKCIDHASGEQLPSWFQDALIDPSIIKTAHNASFEINCLTVWTGLPLDASQWECTMIKASMMGYPLSLDAVAKAMKLAEQKSAAGKALIKFFSNPCKPTKTNGMRTQNLPHHDPVRWAAFIEYCIYDVKVESAIRQKLHWFNFSKMERDVWVMDQKINNSGVLLDVQLIQQAVTLNKIHAERLMKAAISVTGLANPNSVKQLKEWMEKETGETVTSLTKDNVKELLKDSSETMNEMLLLRQEMAMSSIKKYKAMLDCIGLDDRARGLLQLYGAQKTGRWSGRLIQVQNLTKTELKDIGLTRELVRQGLLEELELIFGNVTNTLSRMIRTMFISKTGLIVSDFSAIEARVTAWFANEEWRLRVFAGHGKIYEESGAHMFKVPIESVTKGSDLRAKAKVAELALGYQGSKGAMIKMGALKMGIKDEEIMDIVNKWRAASPKIVKLWYDVDDAAIEAVCNPGTIQKLFMLEFQVRSNTLFIKLPSGRELAYVNPVMAPGKFDRDCINYMGVDQKTKQWVKHDTYGGKLVENIVQGTARDLLADAMLRLDALGIKLVMHVHDEIVAEEKDGRDFEIINSEMNASISWAPGLSLAAETFRTPFYIKD